MVYSKCFKTFAINPILAYFLTTLAGMGNGNEGKLYVCIRRRLY